MLTRLSYAKKSGRENLRSDVVLRILRSMSRCTSSGDPIVLGGTPQQALSKFVDHGFGPHISTKWHPTSISSNSAWARLPARHSGIGLIFREGLDPELSLCIGFQRIGP